MMTYHDTTTFKMRTNNKFHQIIEISLSCFVYNLWWICVCVMCMLHGIIMPLLNEFLLHSILFFDELVAAAPKPFCSHFHWEVEKKRESYTQIDMKLASTNGIKIRNDQIKIKNANYRTIDIYLS